jgi:hypothetical protein
MKNKIVIIIVLLIYSNVFCQEKIKKLYSSIDIEFINPNKVEYYYGLYSPEYKAIIGGQNKIENTGSSFGISYSIHYNVFKKLSLGAITGFQNQNNPDFRMLKLGGSINYFFVDNNNIYAYLNITNNFTLDKTQFKTGTNVRIGIGFPIMKREKFNLNVNLFYETNYLILEGTKPLFNSEIPDNIIFRSYGLGLGIKL